MKCTILLILLVIASCTTPQEPIKATGNIENQHAPNNYYTLTTKNYCEQSLLSYQFDIAIDFKQYSDTTAQQDDSAILKLYVKGKKRKRL